MARSGTWRAAALALVLVLSGCGATAPAGRSAASAGGAATPASSAAAPAGVPAVPPAQAAGQTAQPGASGAAVPIPIVMYHVIAPAPHSPYAYLYVSARRFAREMRGLRRAGYCAISLARARAIWSGQAHAPTGCRPLVLRFDDGYSSVATVAFPVLQRMGWVGNLCQQVQRIDFPGGLRAGQIRAMLAAGWGLADHGYQQPELSLIGATAAQLQLQVATSRQALQRRFGVSVDFYCWPLGYYNAGAVAAARAAGFRGGLGVATGVAAPARQTWWRLDAVPAWGWLSSAALVAQVRRLQAQGPPAERVAFLPG